MNFLCELEIFRCEKLCKLVEREKFENLELNPRSFLNFMMMWNVKNRNLLLFIL